MDLMSLILPVQTPNGIQIHSTQTQNPCSRFRFFGNQQQEAGKKESWKGVSNTE